MRLEQQVEFGAAGTCHWTLWPKKFGTHHLELITRSSRAFVIEDLGVCYGYARPLLETARLHSIVPMAALLSVKANESIHFKSRPVLEQITSENLEYIIGDVHRLLLSRAVI